jgi:hypothetical protein
MSSENYKKSCYSLTLLRISSLWHVSYPRTSWQVRKSNHLRPIYFNGSIRWWDWSKKVCVVGVMSFEFLKLKLSVLPVKGDDRMVLVEHKKTILWEDDHAGDRTQNLLLRRQAPYPLGHTVFSTGRKLAGGTDRQLLVHMLLTLNLSNIFYNWCTWHKSS